jgi:hypothetical protein
LPAVAPDLGVWKQASVYRDCHLQFDRAFYSVPFALVGKSLWLKGNRSLSGVLLQPPSARNNPSHIHQGGAGSDQGDSDQQQVAAA